MVRRIDMVHPVQEAVAMVLTWGGRVRHGFTQFRRL